MRALVPWVLLFLLPTCLLAAAPVIDSLTASSTTVAPGGVVTLELAAHDPDCPDVCDSGCGAYIRADLTQWSAAAGSFTADNGTSGSPYAAGAEWQAPMVEDTYTLEVSVSDSGTWMCGGQGTATASLEVQVTTVINQAPVVDALSAEPVQVHPGDASRLRCSATDPEGEPVSYSWSADSGKVAAGADGEAVFESDSPGLATVTCTATDPSGGPASASVQISVSDAFPERQIVADLGTPQRLAVDSMGDLYAVDRAGGGLTVVHLGSGERVYRLDLPGLTSVAVDWQDDLLIGGRQGARVIDRHGEEVLALDPGEALGSVSDVAVDTLRQRYAVVHRTTGRVVVYDALGGLIAAFGSTGDGASQLKSPRGLAVTPTGEFVVADSGHGLIKVFDLGGNLLAAFGGQGSGAGEFVQLDDVTVDGHGVIYASDSFQDWVQSWNPIGSPAAGTPRETLGTFGSELGRFKTPTGVVAAEAFGTLVVASLNTSTLEVYRLADPPLGDWPAPVAALSRDQLVFGPQPVGTTSIVHRLTLSNFGDAPLGIRSLELPGDYAASDDCGSFIDPGQMCDLAVVFTPRAAGDRDGTMTIATSAGTPFTVGLSGFAFIPAMVRLSELQLEFPEQPVGTLSDPRRVRLTNPGTLALAISEIRPSTHYGQINSCGSQINGGAVCAIDVYFAPQAAGDPITGTLTITSSAIDSPHAVSLLGRAILLEVTVDPVTIYFPAVDVDSVSEPRTITVTNTGDMAVEIGPVALAGDRPGEFVLQSDLCSAAVLAVGESCAIEVAFGPTVAGESAAEISIPNSTGRSPVAVALAGGSDVVLFRDGFESGDLSVWSAFLSTKAVDFAGQRRGEASVEKSFTVTNPGATALEVRPLKVAGDDPDAFFIADDPCSGTHLEPGDTCRVTVVFSPTQSGGAAARIDVRAGAGGSLDPGIVVLTGSGNL